MGHKGLRISDDDAVALAETYVEQLNLRGWQYVSGAAHRGGDGTISVVFDTYSPEGSLVDGPVVFLVDPATGKVTPFEAI